VQLVALGSPVQWKLPRLVTQKLVDVLAGDARGANRQQQSFDFYDENAALQKRVHPIPRCCGNWV